MYLKFVCLIKILGKFRENGSCGYVLKPEYLRDAGDRSHAVRLTVHVISGQQLPKPFADRVGEIIDPYIVLHITGWAYFMPYLLR